MRPPHSTLPRPRTTRSPGRLLRIGSFAAIGLCLVVLADGRPLGAQDREPQPPAPSVCESGRISEVFVDNHSIFPPPSIPEDGRLRWAYRTANAVHMRTRESFIRNELLVEPGDCLDPLLLNESARNLRSFRFIATADVFSVPQPDGTHHVVVDTRDEWTTKLSIGVRFDQGIQFEGIQMVEENFLGRGATLGIFRRQRLERREMGGLISVPRVAGSELGLALSGSGTRAGHSAVQMVERPFLGEVGTHAFRQRFASRRDLHRWVVPDADPITHVVIPLEEGSAEVTFARRFGVPGHLLVVGAGVSHEWVRIDASESVTGIQGGNFDSPVPIDPQMAEAVQVQRTDRSTTRLNFIAGIRRIAFVERRGLDALRGVQDIATGRELLVTVGQSLRGPDDFFGRVEIFGGFARERTVGRLHAAVEGRSVAGGGRPSRDVLAELHTFLYRKVSRPFPQTLVLRGALQAGWRVEAPFQLTLGGADALRGHPEDAWPGGRRVLFAVEDRVPLPGPFPDLVDLGVTVFGDLGRMYAADVPYGRDSGWQGSVGAGLRIGFPAGSSAVIRADVAIPVGHGVPREPILRIHAREWIGILGDFRSLRMDRARRSGVDARFPGVGRDRRY